MRGTLNVRLSTSKPHSPCPSYQALGCPKSPNSRMGLSLPTESGPHLVVTVSSSDGFMCPHSTYGTEAQRCQVTSPNYRGRLSEALSTSATPSARPQAGPYGLDWALSSAVG